MLGSIVEPFVLPVPDASQDLAFGCSITLQLIGNDHAWDVLKSLEQFAEKSPGCVLVAAALHQDIQHISVLIDRSPQVMGLPIDLEKDFIQMPCVTTPRTATTQFIGVGLPKFQTPLSHGFTGANTDALMR